MKKIIQIIGLITLLAVLFANMQYAFTGYGILDNTLAPDVLDQTNFAGD